MVFSKYLLVDKLNKSITIPAKEKKIIRSKYFNIFYRLYFVDHIVVK
jgi:hypothetical protein